MSDIRFRCPECKGKLIIEKGKALSEVPCPLCGKTITAWGAELLDIRFHCPACRAKLTVDRQVAGLEVTCPKCDREIRVPAPPEETPSPRPPPRPPPRCACRFRLSRPPQNRQGAGN